MTKWSRDSRSKRFVLHTKEGSFPASYPQLPLLSNKMDPQEKIRLITQNLQEVLGADLLEDVIVRQQRPLKIYWGMWIDGRDERKKGPRS